MTTYTLTVEQRGQLMTDLAKAYISSEALSMLQSLQPNTQEPSAWIAADGEGFRLRFSNPGQDVPMGWDALYAHPAPQAKPLTDAFAKAASEHGLTLVITVDGYKLMKCGPATAHGVKP